MFTGMCKRGPIKTVQHTDFLTYLRLECKSEKWVYQNIIFLVYLPDLVSVFHSGALRLVCDGSFDKGYGTATWCNDGNWSIICEVDNVLLDKQVFDNNVFIVGVVSVLITTSKFKILQI